MFQDLHRSNITGLPVDVLRNAKQERMATRREFLGKSAKLGSLAAGATLVGGLPMGHAGRTGNPRIVIIGGGLAGLTCAYRLQTRGITSTIYEAAPRLGGRCFTKRGFFQDN